MSETYVRYSPSGELRTSISREVKNPDFREPLSNACMSLPQAVITMYRSKSSTNMTEASDSGLASFSVEQLLIVVWGLIIPVE